MWTRFSGLLHMPVCYLVLEFHFHSGAVPIYSHQTRRSDEIQTLGPECKYVAIFMCFLGISHAICLLSVQLYARFKWTR